MAKGLAILLGGGKPEEMEGPKEGEDDGEELADSVEFAEMFDAFTDALGVRPKDDEAARRRLASLFSIYCRGMDY